MRLGFPCKRFVKHCRIVDASAALTDDSIRPSPSLTPPRSPMPPLAGIVRHCLFAAAFANSSAAFANIFAVSFDDSTCEDREASSLRRHGRFLWQRLRCLSFSQSLWDINMDSGPVATFQVHEYLWPKLCDLYENDPIFDKFECYLSGDGLRIATGSYSTEATTLEACRIL